MEEVHQVRAVLLQEEEEEEGQSLVEEVEVELTEQVEVVENSDPVTQPGLQH